MRILFKTPPEAFTLAEVLITLGIIGVVAALTIPTLIQNANEKATITAVKKAYSVLSQAYTMAENENGTPDSWGITANPSPALLNMMKPYLRISKDCTDSSQGCFPAGVNYKFLATSRGFDGIYDDADIPKLRLSDGTSIKAITSSSTCGAVEGTTLALQNVCGRYFVDINGDKLPNSYGKDLFHFWLTKYGIVPVGSSAETDYTFATECADSNAHRGVGCAAWLIYNENMDYLRCSDLAWNGKHKCG